eukprot:scaffold37052_cov46-Cyclotella_meneghiniana.AAC.5
MTETEPGATTKKLFKESINNARQFKHSLMKKIYIKEESVVNSDFMQLTLDIPEKPLFKDQDGGLVIPQELLLNVLPKFDGVSFCDILAVRQQQQQHRDATESLETKLARIIILYNNQPLWDT